MNKFWKTTVILLMIICVMTAFNLRDATILISRISGICIKLANNDIKTLDLVKDINDRLIKVENSRTNVQLFVERYYNPHEGQHEYRVVDVIETPDVLTKAH